LQRGSIDRAMIGAEGKPATEWQKDDLRDKNCRQRVLNDINLSKVLI